MVLDGQLTFQSACYLPDGPHCSALTAWITDALCPSTWPVGITGRTVYFQHQILTTGVACRAGRGATTAIDIVNRSSGSLGHGQSGPFPR